MTEAGGILFQEGEGGLGRQGRGCGGGKWLQGALGERGASSSVLSSR